jgi:hypothetical protein
LAFYIDIGVAIIEWRPRTTEKKGIITKKNQFVISGRCFAPAMIQFLLSSLIFCRTTECIEDLLLYTLVFLSFQNSQAIKMMADLSPFGAPIGAHKMACHYWRSVGWSNRNSCNREGHDNRDVVARQAATLFWNSSTQKRKCLAISG